MSALQYDGARHFVSLDRKDFFFFYDSTDRKHRSHSVSLIVLLLTHWQQHSGLAFSMHIHSSILFSQWIWCPCWQRKKNCFCILILLQPASVWDKLLSLNRSNKHIQNIFGNRCFGNSFVCFTQIGFWSRLIEERHVSSCHEAEARRKKLYRNDHTTFPPTLTISMTVTVSYDAPATQWVKGVFKWATTELSGHDAQGCTYARSKIRISKAINRQSTKAQCVLPRGTLWHWPCKVSGYKFKPDATSQARSFSCALCCHGPKAARIFSAVRQEKHIGQEDVPRKREAWMVILTIHSYYWHENQCIFQAKDCTDVFWT